MDFRGSYCLLSVSCLNVIIPGLTSYLVLQAAESKTVTEHTLLTYLQGVDSKTVTDT